MPQVTKPHDTSRSLSQSCTRNRHSSIAPPFTGYNTVPLGGWVGRLCSTYYSGTSLRPRQHRPHEPPIRRRQPLIEEDATVASCPVCLYSYDDVEARRQPSMATVQWTACCGQHFHSSCISKLTRCPMCRSDLGVGIGREWRAVRLSAPVLLRAELRLLKPEAAAQPS